MGNTIFEAFNGMSDEEFVELLVRADKEPVINGVTMPGFPDLLFQKNTVGMRGAEDLKLEPYSFVMSIKNYAKKNGMTISKDTTILDFGVGWGRMIRFFFKDIFPENIYGTDVWPIMIDKCNSLLPAGSYHVNAPRPPFDFEDNKFDIIYAYSVFSHLREDVAMMWIEEFSRVLKPNGLLIATTEGDRFFNLCKELIDNPELSEEVPWYQGLAKAFKDVEYYKTRYQNGEFIYAPTGGGATLDSSFYGEAAIPEAYIQNEYGKQLQFRSFKQYHNGVVLPQATFVLQK